MIRIIIAEDQRLLRGAMASLLGLEEDIEVIGEAGDGEEALDLIERLRPDVCLMDIEMPKLSGLELREKVINNEDLRLKSIPYLFFSTSAEQKHVIDAYSRSIQGFFVKPKSYDKLKKMMTKWRSGQ